MRRFERVHSEHVLHVVDHNLVDNSELWFYLTFHNQNRTISVTRDPIDNKITNLRNLHRYIQYTKRILRSTTSRSTSPSLPNHLWEKEKWQKFPNTGCECRKKRYQERTKPLVSQLVGNYWRHTLLVRSRRFDRIKEQSGFPVSDQTPVFLDEDQTNVGDTGVRWWKSVLPCHQTTNQAVLPYLVSAAGKEFESSLRKRWEPSARFDLHTWKKKRRMD